MEDSSRLIRRKDVRGLFGFGANDNVVIVEDEDCVPFHEVVLGHGVAVPFLAWGGLTVAHVYCAV